jgi:glycosyltransferase involved in cell wall biosynthesis
MTSEAQIDIDLVEPDRPSLRIAVITETYPPDINGVARTLAITVEGLRHLGHSITVIRPRHPLEGASQPNRSADVLVKGFPIPFYRQLRMGLPAKRALNRLWSVQRPDVVHIATEGPLGWSALKVAQKLRLPVSTDFRTNFHAYTEHYGVGWLKTPIMAYLRKFHNASHSTMVPTEQLRDELSVLGFERLHVVSRGVDVQRFSPQHRSDSLRQSWGVGPDDVVMLCVSRMATEKNLHIVLQTFKKIALQKPNLRLVMVGDGPLKESLQKDCPQAVFTGFLAESELAQHYASADVFAFPSVTETFGNVSLEAMASGLPVVAFDDAAARYLIQHQTNGMLAAVGDVHAFESHVATLVNDAKLRQTLSARGREAAMLKSWDMIFSEVEHVLLQSMQDAKSLPGSARSAPRAMATV